MNKRLSTICFLGMFVSAFFLGLANPSGVFAADKITLLNNVISTGASVAVSTKLTDRKTFHIKASGVSSGGTMVIQTSLNGNDWVDLNSTTISATGMTEVAVVGLIHNYVRANLTARSDGTYTVQLQTD